MSDKQYTMKRTDNGRAFELWQDDEKVRIFLDPILPISVADALNMETKPLHDEIATLQTANADLLAAVEARNEELGKARNFIQGMKELVDKGNVWLSPQQKLEYLSQELAQWEAETQKAETPSATVAPDTD